MRRSMSNFVLAVSIVLLMAMPVLWWHSYRSADGVAAWRVQRFSAGFDESDNVRGPMVDALPPHAARWGFLFGISSKDALGLGGARHVLFGTPHWAWIVVAAVMPARRGRRWWRVHWRRKHGLCLECGYDLRASSERCPECGTLIRAQGAAHVL